MADNTLDILSSSWMNDIRDDLESVMELLQGGNEEEAIAVLQKSVNALTKERTRKLYGSSGAAEIKYH